MKRERITCLRIRILMFMIFFLMQSVPYAQESNHAKKESTKSLKSFRYDKWLDLKKNLNYSKDKPDKPEKEYKSFNPIQIDSGVIKVILFCLVGAVLVFILLKLFKQPSNKNIDITADGFSLENLEESVHEANLESFLEKAKVNGDYRLVIRIYYLIIIRELSNKKYIFWKKEKTNAEYLKEMRERDSYKIFKELTFLFEWIWFGNKNISEKQYKAMKDNFESYINQLKTN